MNFFEQELRKLFEHSGEISDPRFTGRMCLARLTDTTNVKLEFVTLGIHEKYAGIKATIINRNEGQVDATVFRFSDILGKKAIPGNPNFKDGLSPYIWKCDGVYEWYAYQPTPRDMEILSEAVGGYLEMFGDLTLDHEMGQQMY